MSGAARTCYLASYDISDDKRRLKIAHLLEGYGERVQYSVFEIWVTAREMDKLRTQLQRYVEEEGSVRLYPLCATCMEKRQVLGRGVPTAVADLYVI